MTAGPASPNDTVTIRPARKADCGAIAELFRISSDGLADYIWGQLEVGAGRSLLEIGRARYEREGVAFSYQHCLVADRQGVVVGMLHSFPMEPAEDPCSEPADPILAPYAALEDYGSLYVSGVAVRAPDRGRGIGHRLLAAAETRAADLGLPRISLICFEANEGATRLYRRLGFSETDRRPLVPHPCLKYDQGDAVLLVRDLTRP